jgi:YD repeat-containing protein
MCYQAAARTKWEGTELLLDGIWTDAQGRVTRTQVDSLEPVAFSYDTRGRLSTVTQGTGGSARTSTFTYNPQGFLASITDPLSRTVSFTYDLVGRVTTQTLPDGRVIQTTYVANGNVASITPPSNWGR